MPVPADTMPTCPPSAIALPDVDRGGDLLQIIDAYNRVATNLQRSHETLTDQVKALQSRLASANASLQRSRRLAALGEMAAGIAHEVRNPLASIGLYARMLSEDLGDRPQTRDLAEKIRMAVRGLDGVVSDVLSFARTLKVRRHLAGAEDIFGRALVSVASLLETKKIEIRQEIDPDLPAVPHDPELLHQALVNLLRNAAEAMSDGGLLVLAATADGQSVQMAVRDSGPGIPEEAVDRIFNPFFTTRATGTGLGLAIVHRIVDVHGGSITVHNDRGGGATFTVHLPLSAGPADADQPSLGATQA